MADRPATAARSDGSVGEDTATYLGDALGIELDEHLTDMKSAYKYEAHSLRDLKSRERLASEELDRFKNRHELKRAPRPRWPLAWKLLAVVFVVETVINGSFFGHYSDVPVSGLVEAMLISLFNLVVVGLLGSLVLGQIRLRSPLRRIVGWAGLMVLVLPMALALNLGVAHYRDALGAVDAEESGEARIDLTVVRAPSAAEGGSPIPTLRVPPECQWVSAGGGDTQDKADRLAVCLLIARGFVLASFKSYLLMFIGLAMCAIAIWDWRFKVWDPCPGYRERGDELNRASKDLARAVAGVKSTVEGIYAQARLRQHDCSAASGGDNGVLDRLVQLGRTREAVLDHIRKASGA